MNNHLITDKPIIIALAADIKFSEQIITLIKSICYHHKNYKIKFYLLHKEFPPEWFYFVNRYLNQINCEIISAKVLNNDLHHFKTAEHISEVTYYRYFIGNLPEDRILYLDSDTIVNSNLFDFYYQDFQDKFAVVITDMYLNYNQHLIDIRPYFNAGVLLINNQKWKEYNTLDKLIQLTEFYSDDITYADQDILNILLHKNILFADKIYNYQTGAKFGYCPYELCEEAKAMEELEQEPIIIHYTTPNKPWLLARETKFIDKYWFYYKLEWQEIIKNHSIKG